MSEKENKVQSFNVEFYDSWLEVEDFTVVSAESEEDARETFLEEHDEEDRREVRNVELAYDVNKSKVDEIVG